MKSKHLVGVLMLALLWSGWAATAQTPSSPIPVEQQKAKKELERKALVLLNDIIKDAQAFRLPENRLHLKAVSASLLWKYDEARARVLFKETMAGIVDLLNSQAETDAPTSHFFQGPVQLRREVVQMLAPRDARMARDFLRATHQAYARLSKAQFGEADNDLQLEYSIATQITETDPKQALELAEDSLAKGFSPEVINTLSSLQGKDPEAAAKLAGEIVAKLRTENLTANQQAAQIATTLLDIVFNSSAESTNKETDKARPLLDEQGMRELMELNVNLALNSPSYSGRLRRLERMMPQVQKYAPARVAELRRKAAQFRGTNADEEEEEDGSTPDWERYRGLIMKGTAEELLAAAEKAPQGIRENLYLVAASKFAEKGETERARDIINNHVTDPAARKQLLEKLEQQSSLVVAAQGQADEVRKSLVNLRTNEERAVALAQVARALAAKGEKKLSRQLLEEAQGLVSNRAKNIKQLGAQLLIAQAYVKLDPARTLAMLEPIVDQLNELLAAAAMLGGFVLDEEVMRDDELRFEVFTEVLPMLTGPYTLDLQTLAVYDFDRTRALADRFQRDEVRMMARLLVVESLLGEDGTPSAQLRETTTTISSELPGPNTQAGEDGTP
jgi:hypothetical protein